MPDPSLAAPSSPTSASPDPTSFMPPMPTPVRPGTPEHVSGMEVFYTDTPPLGGKLRVIAEDFVVEELGPPPRRVPDGKHLAVRLTLTDWEHNHFIRDATRRIGISRNGVGFAGMKDKRAVTTQWFTFQVDKRKDDDVTAAINGLPRVEVHEWHRTHKSLRLGMHEGNRFAIRIRRVPGAVDDVSDHMARVLGAIEAVGGFPNFFGIQRFGAVRPITHKVGEELVHGRLENAIVTYLTVPGDNESDEIAAARDMVTNGRDWAGALQAFPTSMRFERSMLQHLANHPDDLTGAIKQLPSNLILLFVHSYQSYLFNQMLSERIRRKLPLHRALVGDIVFIAQQGLVGRNPVAVPVTDANVEKVNRQMAKGRAVVTLPLFGTETELADGDPGEMERAVLRAAGVSADLFDIPVLPQAASKGMRRAILTPARDLSWDVRSDDGDPDGRLLVTCRFSLPRGAYATTLLREVMKAEDTTQY